MESATKAQRQSSGIPASRDAEEMLLINQIQCEPRNWGAIEFGGRLINPSPTLSHLIALFCSTADSSANETSSSRGGDVSQINSWG